MELRARGLRNFEISEELGIPKGTVSRLLRSRLSADQTTDFEDAMKNKLQDLTDHLFAQLERLNDEGVQGDALAEEIKRAGAVASVSSQIIAVSNVRLQAARIRLSQPRQR